MYKTLYYIINLVRNKTFFYVLFFLIFMYLYYTYHKNVKHEYVSELYNKVICSLYNSDYHTTVHFSNIIIKKYNNIYYRDCCLLLLSNFELKKNNINLSIFYLRKLIDQGIDNYLNNVAVMRLCKVLYSNNMIMEVMNLINEYKIKLYSSLYEEIKGDMYMYINKNDKGKIAYLKSLNNINTNYNIYSIKIKINNMGLII
ncbi:MAG: tetratricopeptide repeat protein [Candidatus Azosocius agrarius]|nr:MAG: tetratricopeptide repeat protein [Gammaproteobacteria bacterium]